MLTWNDFRRDEEGDPGHHHEEAGWKVVGDDVVGDVPLKDHLEAGQTGNREKFIGFVNR